MANGRTRVLMSLLGLGLGTGFAVPVLAQGEPADMDQQKRRALACEAADQLIQVPLEKTLNRTGFLYECQAIPEGDTFIVSGRLQVRGSGGPTQAQYYGRIKPNWEGRPDDWTFCTLTINGLEAGVPGC